MPSCDAGIEAVRTRIGTAVRSAITGQAAPPRVRFRDDPDDAGLFGRGSVAWRLHADASTLVGGLRALLLQTLHPLAMAGVAGHSDYRHDPWGRLHRTAEFLGTTIYAPTPAALRAVERVRAVHRQVVGTAPDGRPYAASDPHLLTFVHVTEVDSFLAAYRRYGAGGRLSEAEADRYVAEMAQVGELLGAEEVPTTAVGLRDWLEAVRPELHVGAQCRDAVRFLLVPPMSPVARGPYGLIAAAAVGLLPGWARRKLWLPLAPGAEPLLVRPAATGLL
ncbi:MAG TPA: oxygenase MpaB family protein, partial [Acidimicrobiales bacterium]|nr:oxygenase MpaB family protein [Acidimicrobiales bacterium]